MIAHWLTIVFPFILAAQDTTTIAFKSEVRRGETLEHSLQPNLIFRLIPIEFGWLISIGDTLSPDRNYCALVTPPYRGINAIYLEGWHFRNSDNSGPNDIGPKNINAPGEEREFLFVVNAHDQQTAFDTRQRLMWPHKYSPQEVDSAQDVHERLKKGRGVVIVKDLKLNNLIVGQRAGIEYLKFEAVFTFPVNY